MKKTYHNDAKIYRVFSPVCEYDYIGSTVEPLNILLRKLKLKAKAFRTSIEEDMKKQVELPPNLKRYKRRTTEFDPLYEAMEQYGYDHWRIELLKEFQCENRYELECEASKIMIQRQKREKIPDALN